MVLLSLLSVVILLIISPRRLVGFFSSKKRIPCISLMVHGLSFRFLSVHCSVPFMQKISPIAEADVFHSEVDCSLKSENNLNPSCLVEVCCSILTFAELIILLILDNYVLNVMPYDCFEHNSMYLESLNITKRSLQHFLINLEEIFLALSVKTLFYCLSPSRFATCVLIKQEGLHLRYFLNVNLSVNFELLDSIIGTVVSHIYILDPVLTIVETVKTANSLSV